ncbi:nuclear transport factor 2 family protein [Rickettsiaceae bacterium]|nr:nuclear transport factor 2 family protein [Rickettsiaceae bacterium]
MNTTNSIAEENLKAALSYYNAMLVKDFDAMASHLSNDACLISPLAQITGKEEVITAAKNFGKLLNDIQISSSFSNNNQIMLSYDMIVPEPIGKFRAAALMDFKNGKITKIELFYDARPFEVKK